MCEKKQSLIRCSLNINDDFLINVICSMTMIKMSDKQMFLYDSTVNQLAPKTILFKGT